MLNKCQNMYHLESLNLDNSLEELKRLFEHVLNFSNKAHNHLKYLVFLVNNLIESEDSLDLLE